MSWKAFRVYLTSANREFVESQPSIAESMCNNVKIFTTQPTTRNADEPAKTADVTSWFCQRGFDLMRQTSDYTILKKEGVEAIVSSESGSVVEVAIKILITDNAREQTHTWYKLVERLCAEFGFHMKGSLSNPPSYGEFFSVVEKTFAWRSFLQIEERQSQSISVD